MRAIQTQRGPVLRLRANQEDASKRADDGPPLHSFRTLPKELGTLTYNITHTALNPEAKIVLTTGPAPLQDKAFRLIALNPPPVPIPMNVQDETNKRCTVEQPL